MDVTTSDNQNVLQHQKIAVHLLITRGGWIFILHQHVFIPPNNKHYEKVSALRCNRRLLEKVKFLVTV